MRIYYIYYYTLFVVIVYIVYIPRIYHSPTIHSIKKKHKKINNKFSYKNQIF